MATLTLRNTKGSPLTYTEGDNNWTALNDSSGNLKNYLINGNFDFWQRGTSTSTNGAFLADRWQNSFGASGGGVGTATRQSFAIGQTNVPGEPTYYLRHNRTTASSSASVLAQQRIEGVRTLAGQTAVASVWMRVTSGTKTIRLAATQNFGTGGSPSATVVVATSDVSVTTAWQRFTIALSFASISGKTIGTNNDDFVSFEIQEAASFGTFTLDMAQAQVEKGTLATEFQTRPFAAELVLCQRYFEKSYNLDVAPGTANSQGVSIGFMAAASTSLDVLNTQFKAQKRAVPTIVWYSNSTGASGNVRNITTSADVSISSTANTGQVNTGTAISGAAVSDGHRLSAQWTASSEL